jgi:methionine-S-sulfoxide reductase
MSANLPDETVPGRRRWLLGLAAVSVLASVVALAQSPTRQPGAEPRASPAPGKSPVTQQGGAAMTSPSASQAGKEREVAVLAGGCFWGMQDLLRKIPGVLETEVGYTGGWVANPRYEDTHDSRSGHAEAVRIVFDPRVLSYADLLEKWFFRMHDPTTLNRQGNDKGTQYRSAIFVADDAQRAVAEAVKARVQASGHWKGTITTEIAQASAWYKAEDYHQDYLEKHSGGYTCHFLRPW